MSLFKNISILGVKVSAINMPIALDTIDHWIETRDQNYVCIRDVHGVIASLDDESFRDIHTKAGMVTPDGMPVVWASRMLGHRQVRKVSGSDLMEIVCAGSAEKGQRHFFYGAAPGVAQDLADKLAERYPGFHIAGVYCPPFRELTQKEDQKIIEYINQSNANIVWVGLGSPKQERWMAEHLGKLDAQVMLGVGAAFDFLNGTVRRAPRWMQKSGLEWFYRLIVEPRRLWRRYLLVTPRFIPLALMQIFGLRKYPGFKDARSKQVSSL